MGAKETSKRPIIIKKVKKKAAGHHGGSWKVAYADFVTAMMAFFLVMWIVGLDEGTRRAIEGYFSDPIGFRRGYSSGASPVSSGRSPAAVQSPPLHLLANAMERAVFMEVGDRIKVRLGEEGLGGLISQVEIVVTEEGLRIELIEGEDGENFFPFGSAAIKPPGRQILGLIARELAPLDNVVVIEGHTDAAQFASPGYTNWELSADRANAARRVLMAGGIADDRIREVRGHADRYLRVPDDPLHPSNRRISVLLPFRASPGPPQVGLPAI